MRLARLSVSARVPGGRRAGQGSSLTLCKGYSRRWVTGSIPPAAVAWRPRHYSCGNPSLPRPSPPNCCPVPPPSLHAQLAFSSRGTHAPPFAPFACMSCFCQDPQRPRSGQVDIPSIYIYFFSDECPVPAQHAPALDPQPLPPARGQNGSDSRTASDQNGPLLRPRQPDGQLRRAPRRGRPRRRGRRPPPPRPLPRPPLSPAATAWKASVWPTRGGPHSTFRRR